MPLFFDTGAFLEHLRDTVETGLERPTFLTTVPENTQPEPPYVVIHQFGPTGPKAYALEGKAVTISFYLQVDGIGRNYKDALWALDEAVSILRNVEPPSFVNDLLVYARSSPFELEDIALRSLGQRLGMQATRAVA